MSKTVVVVAAHADDEVLGCGGTIAKHVLSGDKVHVIFVADGVTSRNRNAEGEIVIRQKASESARTILGISTIKLLNLPDNQLDTLPLLKIIQQLEQILGMLAPEIIYTHHYGDLNIDHRITHQAVMTACRPLPGSTIKEIHTFEVISSTEWNSPSFAPFLPNLYVDISAHMDFKMLAIEAYKMEMRLTPHSRSIENLRHLAKYRGNSVGVDAAEAFMTMRVCR